MPDHTPDSWEHRTGRDISTITAQEARDELHLRCPIYRALMARETVERNAVSCINCDYHKRIERALPCGRWGGPTVPDNAKGCCDFRRG